MKNILLYICYIFFVFLPFNKTATASDVKISGSVQFECSLLSKYMKKHDYYFIREVIYENKINTNLFAAKDAEVIIRNESDTVLGTGRTDRKGNFSISVPEQEIYTIVIRFHDREMVYTTSYSDAGEIIANIGYFDTGTVDGWIPEIPITYCKTCDIRYLENQEAMEKESILQ